MPLALCSECPPRVRVRCLTSSLFPSTCVYPNAPPLRFVGSTTYRDRDSDLHRVYLTRLCYASRLSQPLDVLFRPHPPCLVSYRSVHELAVFRDFPLTMAADASRHKLSFMPLHLPRTEARDGASTTERSMMSFKDLSAGEVRSHPRQCYPPERAVPLMTFSSPRFTHLSLDTMLPQRLLLWASPHAQTTEAALSMYWLSRVLKN